MSHDNSHLTRAEVRFVQQRLDDHGFHPGPIDGILGPRTSAAIVAFKRSRGLTARPWVGPLTMEALRSAVALPDFDATPPWIREAGRIIGWHERAQNRALRDWLRSDGRALGDPAVLPWCGDFAETALRLGLPTEPFPGPLGVNPYWALNWRHLGEPCLPCFGAVISIRRKGGGHVGFAVGEDAGRFFVLGGNQDNEVSVAPIAKSRFEPASWRWPVTYSGPQLPLRPMTSAAASVVDFA